MRIGEKMIKLIQNEMIKILKRKNVYILLILTVFIMIGYNFYGKYNTIKLGSIDMMKQYERLYKQDKLYLESYDSLEVKEEYTDIVERVELEKYAMENHIPYNLLVNTENKNVVLPLDARISWMKVFNHFEVIFMILIIYITSTIISEEFSTGTIKSLLVKPHKRTTIIFAKVITSFLAILVISLFVLIFQYIIGGLFFGFESYQLEAIRYNHLSNQINTMPLNNYMSGLLLSKIPKYILVSLVSLLLGVITSNIAINILTSFGVYGLLTINLWGNVIGKKMLISNFDLSEYLFGNLPNTAIPSMTILILIVSITIVILLTLLVKIVNRKEIINQ